MDRPGEESLCGWPVLALSHLIGPLPLYLLVQQQQRPPSRGQEDEERPEEEHAEKDEKVRCAACGRRAAVGCRHLPFCWLCGGQPGCCVAHAARQQCDALTVPLTLLQGEDWEHEEAAADDDLDMGESEEEDAPSPVRK